MRGSAVAWRWDDDEEDAGAQRESPGRRRVRMLSHADLLAEMRKDDPWAWGEFAARFRPLLEEYATQTGLPEWEWDECIENVLDDEAMRLTEPGAVVPERFEAYLVQAVWHRRLSMMRARQRRARRETDALDMQSDDEREGVLRLLCSEHALHQSDRGARGVVRLAPGLARLAAEILKHTRPDEQQILEWLGQRATHRQIATWLGVRYDAATKRIWRLCGRLRTIVPEIVASFPPDERREAERYLRRALSTRSTSPLGNHGDRRHEGTARRRRGE